MPCKVLLLVGLILFFCVSQLDESQSQPQVIDVQKVPSCPASKKKWLEDAIAKNCSSKNVALKYHCLLNHWRNQSFVFCGEDKHIIGFFCPEFDEKRGKIQENYDFRCPGLSNASFLMYRSSEVFHYPACIKSELSDISITETETNFVDRGMSEQKLQLFIVPLILSLIMSLIVPLLILTVFLPIFLPINLTLKGSREYQEKEVPIEKKGSWSKPINSLSIKKLFASIIKEIQQPTSDFSFAPELFDCVNLNDIILEIKSLSREVLLNKMIMTTVDTSNTKCGNVFVTDVTVTCKKNQLTVNHKDPNEWKRFLQANQTDIVRVILIHSKSVRFIEAKLKVYKEYQAVIDSSNIFLQHVDDDFDEIAKLSVHNKLTRLCDDVQTLCKSVDLEYLNNILETAVDNVLTEENISGLCLEDYDSNILAVDNALTQETKSGLCLEDYDYSILSFSKNQTLSEKRIESFQTRMKYLNSLQIDFKILLQVKPLIKRKNLLDLPLKLKMHRVLTEKFISKKSWSREDEYFNEEEMKERAAIDISCMRREVFEDISFAIKTTENDLKNVSMKLFKIQQDLKLVDQKKDIKTWEKREALQCLPGLEKYPSVLKYIAGWKDNKPTIKVFLSYYDTGAIDFFKDNDQIPNGTYFEFVNVAEKSKEKRKTEKVDFSSFPDENYIRAVLGNIINKHAKQLYAKHSSIVGLDAPGYMFLKGKGHPCIIMYSLDKDLIPYGEDPLPKHLDGWHCDIREDIVMFGMCFDCRQIPYPNPGCCIGLPSNGIGSAGFLAKATGSKSPATGFLTAAHVAARNWTDLYDYNELLSNMDTNGCRDEIAHPLLPGCTDYKFIGKVKESFCGNWGEECIGMDAAFVQNFEPRSGEYSELHIADENILRFNVSKVMKRGGSTGETEGLLTGNTLSVCVDKDFSSGGFYYFARCFSIESIGRPFFEKGDSGSGVFLMENGRPTKPLGIAFAKLMINHNTAVCRIDKIAEAFGLSVCQNEEPMEI